MLSWEEYPELSNVGLLYWKVRDREDVRKAAELEWGEVRETPSAFAGFKDGSRPRAKKCGQILKAERDRKQSPQKNTKEHSPTNISFQWKSFWTKRERSCVVSSN